MLTLEPGVGLRSTKFYKEVHMLVLSRKTDEEIVIPSLNIRIQILDSRKNRVRIGIDAPEDVRIERGEKADAERPLSIPAGKCMPQASRQSRMDRSVA